MKKNGEWREVDPGNQSLQARLAPNKTVGIRARIVDNSQLDESSVFVRSVSTGNQIVENAMGPMSPLNQSHYFELTFLIPAGLEGTYEFTIVASDKEGHEAVRRGSFLVV